MQSELLSACDHPWMLCVGWLHIEQTLRELIISLPSEEITESKAYIIVFKTSCQWCLSWTAEIQFISLHCISLRSFLILLPQLSLGLQSGVFLSGTMTKIRTTFLLCSMCATCPSHLICFDITLNVFCNLQVLKIGSLRFYVASCYPFSLTTLTSVSSQTALICCETYIIGCKADGCVLCNLLGIKWPKNKLPVLIVMNVRRITRTCHGSHG